MLAVVLPFDVLQFVDRDDHVVAVVGEYKAVLQCMPFLQHDECIFLLHADFCNGACIEAPHAGPFDVAVPCHRDHDFLFSDENFFLKFYRLYFILYDTPPRGGIFFTDVSQFLLDYGQQFLFIAEYFPQLVDCIFKFIMLRFKFDDIRIRQPVQLEHDDGFRLGFSEIERLHQIVLGIPLVFRFPNHTDHFIQHGQCFHQPFDDVHPLFRFFEFIFRTVADHFLLMSDICFQYFFESKKLRRPVADGHHIEVIGNLEVRLLVEEVDDPLDICILPCFNDHTLAVTVCFIPDFNDAVHFPVCTDFVNLLHKVRLVHFKRQLNDDDMRLAASSCLGPHFTADDDFSLARFIGFPGLGDTLDDAARRDIRSLDDRHQFIDLHSRLIYDFECRINDFLEVMRRYFRG